MRLPFLFAALIAAPQPASARELKVCADPNNLPFSNQREEGFENKIVRIIAEELGASVTWVWHAQRRGNIRETLNAGRCDLIPGVASSLEMLGTTRPYYRSTYVAVARKGSLSDLNHFDDERLPRLKVGVQLIGDDGANTPPAHSLSRRGMIENVRGFTIYGDYRQSAPQSAIVDAVARGDIDIAFVWGPTGGYFANRYEDQLSVAPVAPQTDGPALAMVFDISMGVRRDDRALRRELDGALRRRATEIRDIVAAHGVPVVAAQD